MKKYFMLTLVALFTVGFSVSAQNKTKEKQNDKGNNRPRQEMRMTAKERAEWMTKELNLTDTQKSEVQALLEKQDAKRNEEMSKMKEQREKMIENRDKAREEMRISREKEMKENQAELEKIIGKENIEKLNSIRQERMKVNREGRRKLTE